MKLSDFIEDDGGHLFPCENCVFEVCVRIIDRDGKQVHKGIMPGRDRSRSPR